MTLLLTPSDSVVYSLCCPASQRLACLQGMCATSAGGRTRWHTRTRGAMPGTLCWTTCRTRTTRPWSSLTSTWCTSTSSASAFDGPFQLQTSLVSPLMVCSYTHTQLLQHAAELLSSVAGLVLLLSMPSLMGRSGQVWQWFTSLS